MCFFLQSNAEDNAYIFWSMSNANCNEMLIQGFFAILLFILFGLFQLFIRCICFDYKVTVFLHNDYRQLLKIPRSMNTIKK